MFTELRNGNSLKLKSLRLLWALTFVVAGLSHFFFYREFSEAIPEVIPQKIFLNVVVGITEVVLGLLSLTTWSRFSYWGTFFLLIIYIWSHVYFINHGCCVAGFCVPRWIAWLRLVLVHPLLLYTNYYLIRNDGD